MSDINEKIRADYDSVPYESFPFPQTRPGHLAAIAHIFGLSTPNSGTARILELGCASGGNIIPLAINHPDARIVGIDLSSVQIARGRALVEALGLRNIELYRADIAALDQNLGTFDYIICHGVFSWVPRAVQDRILDICRENLAGDGVAYISYNCYPGWKFKEIVRDAMILRGMDSRAEANPLGYARGMIDFLKQVVPEESLMGRAIEEGNDILGRSQDYYLTHEYLESINDPIYFRDFVARAETAGLGYLADAQISTMFVSNYGEQVATPLLKECGDSQVRLEQYLDFVGNRTFRQTLLVHRERVEDIRYKLDPEQLKTLHVAAFLPLREVQGTSTFGASAYGPVNEQPVFLGTPATQMAAAMLTQRWPATWAFPDLLEGVKVGMASSAEDTEQIGVELVDLVELLVIRARAKIDLAPVTPTVQLEAGKAIMPECWRCYAAQTGIAGAAHVVNMWHEAIFLDALEHHVVDALDEESTRDVIVDLVLRGVDAGMLQLQRDGREPISGDQAIRDTAIELVDRMLAGFEKRFMLSNGGGGRDRTGGQAKRGGAGPLA